MLDSTKTKNNDLRFLLKDKYNLSELEITDIFNNKTVPSTKILNDINKLTLGHPVDYLIGYKDFLDLKIDLSYKPLIPRVETEYWVQKAIEENQNKKNLKVLDIFCGSGCIGLALLKHLEMEHLTLSDIEPKFIKQTKLNLEINSLPQEKISLVKSDMFANIDGVFDLIFANPPYVSTKEEVGKETKFEPQSAIFASNNGLNLIETFLNKANTYLKDSGLIYMEIGSNQKDKVNKILKNLNYTKWEFYKDQFNRYRWVKINK